MKSGFTGQYPHLKLDQDLFENNTHKPTVKASDVNQATEKAEFREDFSTVDSIHFIRHII